MRNRFTLVASAVITLVPSVLRGQSAPVGRAALAQVTDSLANAALRAGPVAALSIAVIRGRDTVVMKGYGSADIENDVPATAETVYRIGSVTKQFTSVAVMQLVEEGKISLDDEVTKYLPGYPTHGRRVLVRHLMNHTSGIPSYTDVGAKFGRRMRLDLSHDSLLAIVREDSLQFDPGTHFYYNNTGYYMLGMIIERVTGKSYGDHLRDKLFTPHGLNATVYCGDSPVIKRRARGYGRGPNGLVNADFISMNLPFAAGALCSTVGDLATWTRLLHDGKLVNAASFRTMTTPVTLTSGRPMSYGYGLSIDSLGSHRVIHHGGGINGFISELAHYPDDSLTIAVLANTAPAPSEQIAENIARTAFGMPLRSAPERPGDLPIAADERDRLVGNYRLTGPDGSRRTIRVFVDGQQLMAQMEGQQQAFRLQKQQAPNTFAASGQPGRIVFDTSGGKVTGFYWDRGARPLEAVRVP